MQTLPIVLPQLETERLRLRAMRGSDIDALFAIYGDPEVMRYASDDPFTEPATVLMMLTSVEQLLAEGSSLEWSIVERSRGELIGTCSLHHFDPSTASAEIGCILARSAWGRGIMQEALRSVLEYARKTLGLIRLRAYIDALNSRSTRLFTALGFRHVQDTFYELVL